MCLNYALGYVQIIMLKNKKQKATTHTGTHLLIPRLAQSCCLHACGVLGFLVFCFLFRFVLFVYFCFVLWLYIRSEQKGTGHSCLLCLDFKNY